MKCLDCQYWSNENEDRTNTIGVCHWAPFPQPPKRPNEWCGQWKAKQGFAPVGLDMTPPVQPEPKKRRKP